jgi:hypothetical protein
VAEKAKSGGLCGLSRIGVVKRGRRANQQTKMHFKSIISLVWPARVSLLAFSTSTNAALPLCSGLIPLRSFPSLSLFFPSLFFFPLSFFSLSLFFPRSPFSLGSWGLSLGIHVPTYPFFPAQPNSCATSLDNTFQCV